MTALKQISSQPHQLSQSVNHAINEICLLQKSIEQEKSENKQSIAIALLHQKRILAELQQLANAGSALAAAGYVKACCITGNHVDYIFNYRDNYQIPYGVSYLQKLFEPQHLLPFLLKYNVLNKVKSISSFATDLPDISQLKLTSFLYDSLHVKNDAGKTFGEELALKLKETYTAADNPFQQNIALKIIGLTAKKGYAPVQLLYGQLLSENGRQTEAQEAYQSVLCNKLSTPNETALAYSKLKLKHARPLQNLHSFREKSRAIAGA